jgi:predicted component of type VI protein secretion system
MSARLVALDEGLDIPVDRAMLVVGRHPQCDARLDSIRVSRRHCCMTNDNGELIVKDLGSTNGIRINGQRVEMGRLRPGDELSIAHIRYRLDGGESQPEMTLADNFERRLDNPHAHVAARMLAEPVAAAVVAAPLIAEPVEAVAVASLAAIPVHAVPAENPLAAAVRELLPASVADRCRIQVIVQMNPDGAPNSEEAQPACPRDSSH